MSDAPDIVLKLVAQFKRNYESYLQGPYGETQLRREYIDPLFKALGWDIDNSAGYAEAYKDVVHEDSIKTDGGTKAPDYSFRIGGIRKFFLEAKRPSVRINDNRTATFQLRRYAWSAKLPLSILTNFAELAIYDCRFKPQKNDLASKGRIIDILYPSLIERWDELASIFSKDAVLKGSFDKYAGSKRKRGTLAVDAAFLSELESWRELLAKNIYDRNHLSLSELNYAIQQTIDRIVFLRICEDRGLEEFGALQALQFGGKIYERLKQLYFAADDKYNSGLFHFKKETRRYTPPDSMTLSLRIDDKPLRDILQRLYYPESPYEFSVIPADILGHVYEQFLGKVVSVSGHKLTIEEKPEVRKAGGVYYTPSYVVNYIVSETIGPLLDGKTPEEVERICILDPACGSGSFLISAYHYLLDWHLNYYVRSNPQALARRRRPRLRQVDSETWRLTTDERTRILLSCIYGVDIDPQAVEVTKLSLLLKVLEGETQETISQQLRLLHARALPDLDANIRCGNSLIAQDFYEGRKAQNLTVEQKRLINAFNWRDEFPTIFRDGGFSVVLGNPPYIQLSMAAYYNELVSLYLARHYSSSMGRMNTFGFFIAKALNDLLSEDGYFGYIVPNTILSQDYYEDLRLLMLRNTITSLTTYAYPVFEDAVVETAVVICEKTHPHLNKVQLRFIDNRTGRIQSHEVRQSLFLRTDKHAFPVRANEEALQLKKVLDKVDPPLDRVANLNQAIALKHDRAKSLFDKAMGPNYKRVIDGRNIGRYSLAWSGQYLAYDVRNIHSCKRTDIFEAPEKLLFRRVGDRLIAAYDNRRFYALNTLVVITPKAEYNISLKYLLGLLNSKLLDFYYFTYIKSTKRIFSEIQARQLGRIPVCLVDKSNEDDAQRLVQLVDEMLVLRRRASRARAPQEKQVLERRTKAVDSEIDRVVYRLYGLTEQQTKLVEREWLGLQSEEDAAS
ncbi:MAG TPA: TaqI-like C-terminal specificity domain-containing protein [Candidatus Cybelea sp.]|nr:TaqI-like C-terminal specificity domain-containing protein [Candidatus Cybelea sp.]